MVKEIADDKLLTPQLTKDTVKEYILEVINAGLLNMSGLQKDMISSIDKLKQEQN